MDFSKVENFLRTHWPACIVVLIISVPLIWSLATIHYAQQISTLRDRVTTLEVQVIDLKESKKRAEKLEEDRKKKKFSGGIVGFSSQSLADSLYSPSDL
jgi:hypothetical protein